MGSALTKKKAPKNGNAAMAPGFPQQPPQFQQGLPQFQQVPPQFQQVPPQFQQAQPQFQAKPQFSSLPSQFQPSQQGFYPQGGSGQAMSSLPGMIGNYPININEQTQDLDIFLANITGWSLPEIAQLRQEFKRYANHHGVIDREAFRKIYISSLLNTSWENVEHRTEIAFRNFDINKTGSMDFYEYMTATARMARELRGSQSQPTNPQLRY